MTAAFQSISPDAVLLDGERVKVILLMKEGDVSRIGGNALGELPDAVRFL